jgi:GNAT superfamily N-acetyltransferase
MELIALKKDELRGRLQQFCDLYHHCFNDHIDNNIIEHRYLQNPIDELFMFVAIDHGKIVANYSVTPNYLQYNGRRIKSALSLNTMTHPEYVGRGLFVELASMLYDELRKQGYWMVYGFPNYISNRTFCSKLGWRDIYEIPTLELVIDNPIGFDRSNVFMASDYAISPTLEKRIHVSKTEMYLHWRYQSKPYTQYYCIKTQSGSWAVYKYYQNMVNIVELHVNNDTDLVDLIGFISEMVINEGLEKMTVWSEVNSKTHLGLEKLGFRNRYPITYFGACVLNESENIDIWDYRNWSIQMGDDNVY